MPVRPFRFALPPSVDVGLWHQVGVKLRRTLEKMVNGPADVTISQNYEVLTHNLLSGVVDAAWAPPWVCANTASAGARVLAQAQRDGVRTYASAMVSRRARPLSRDGLRGAQVAWIDPYSVAGYLLPAAHLEQRLGSTANLWGAQHFAGSYGNALQALVDGDCDVTAVHCSPEHEESWRASAARYVGPRADALYLLDRTVSVPSDGIVLSSKFLAAREKGALDALTTSWVGLVHDDDGSELLQQLFVAEAFVPTASGAYDVLHHLIRKPTTS